METTATKTGAARRAKSKKVGGASSTAAAAPTATTAIAEGAIKPTPITAEELVARLAPKDGRRVHAGVEVPVDLLSENVDLFTSYDEQHVQKLAAMVFQGQRLLPIVVGLSLGEDGAPKWDIIDGHHRLAGHKLAKRTMIEAEVHIGLSRREIAELSAKIHAHRRDESAWDMLAAVKHALDQNKDITTAELGEKLQLSESYVKQMKRVLLSCPEALQQEFRRKPETYTWAMMRHIATTLDEKGGIPGGTSAEKAVAMAEEIVADLKAYRANKKATKKAMVEKRNQALSPELASQHFLKTLLAGGIKDDHAKAIVGALDGAKKTMMGANVPRDVLRDAYGILFKFSVE